MTGTYSFPNCNRSHWPRYSEMSKWASSPWWISSAELWSWSPVTSLMLKEPQLLNKHLRVDTYVKINRSKLAFPSQTHLARVNTTSAPPAAWDRNGEPSAPSRHPHIHPFKSCGSCFRSHLALVQPSIPIPIVLAQAVSAHHWTSTSPTQTSHFTCSNQSGLSKPKWHQDNPIGDSLITSCCT